MLRDHQILNPQLLERLASAGHGDIVVVADAGLPISDGTCVIDLSLVPGIPSFGQVLEVVLASLHVDTAVISNESRDHDIGIQLDQLLSGLPIESVDHEHFKDLSRRSHVVIRTGECTPYANVALVAGVIF